MVALPKIGIAIAGRVKDFEGQDRLKLVTDSQELKSFQDYLGVAREEFGSMLIESKDGEVKQAFGMFNNTPKDEDLVFRIVRGKK